MAEHFFLSARKIVQKFSSHKGRVSQSSKFDLRRTFQPKLEGRAVAAMFGAADLWVPLQRDIGRGGAAEGSQVFDLWKLVQSELGGSTSSRLRRIDLGLLLQPELLGLMFSLPQQIFCALVSSSSLQLGIGTLARRWHPMAPPSSKRA